MTENTYTVREILEKNGFLIYRIKGVSMLPLLREAKDSVCLTSLHQDTSKLKIGDVVLFERNNGSLVLHRIIGIKARYCRICGDNCNHAEKIPKKRILAVMTGFYKESVFHSVDDDEYKKYTLKILSEEPRQRKIISPIRETWTQILCLLKDAITGVGNSASFENADWNHIYQLAKYHSIAATIAESVKKYGCPEDIFHKFSTSLHKNIERRLLFRQESGSILQQFDKNHIKYIILKGAVLSNLYPKDGMRQFADYDILLSPDCNLSNVYQIMQSFGYEKHDGEIHDSFYKKPYYNFEIHKELFSKEFEFHSYFRNIFERSESINETECQMTSNDFYCYIIAHLYKHYSHGGSGLRSIVDIWLLQKFYFKNNLSIPRDLLKQLGLSDFEIKITGIADAVFEEQSRISCEDISFIMESGTYGSVIHQIEKGYREVGKWRFILQKLFPQIHSMRTNFPVLNKTPILLPLCWIIRIFKCLFRKYSRRYALLLLKTKRKQY